MRSSRAAEGKEKQVPAWVGTYFRQAYDSQQRLMQVVSLSRRGIGSITALPRLARALARVQGEEEDPDAIRLAEDDAAFAKSEIETGFPVLHSLAVVGLWSWLEHLVKGLVIEKLIHDRSAIRSPALQRIKVRLSDYVSLTKREQAAYLVDLLEQETASPLKRGVNRFETLLEPFGLTGDVTEETAKALFELQQLRNAIAHQNGRCDRRLKTAVPWLKLKLHEPIAVGAKQIDSYAVAATYYALDVLYRVGDVHGVDLRS